MCVPVEQEPTRAPGSAAAFCSILFAPPTALPFDDMLVAVRAAGTPVLLCYGKDDPWVRQAPPSARCPLTELGLTPTVF
jgi:hypothetical protein